MTIERFAYAIEWAVMLRSGAAASIADAQLVEDGRPLLSDPITPFFLDAPETWRAVSEADIVANRAAEYRLDKGEVGLSERAG